MEKLPFECGVSLSREEYVRSQELIAKRSGRTGLFFGSGLLSAAMLVLCILFFLVDFKQNGTPDLSLLGLLVLLIVVEVTTVFRYPQMQTKLAAQSYDKTVFSGYSFDGVLHVGGIDIQKTTAAGVTSISYFNCPLFIEAPDMMIFCAPQGRSIVIPARFLTEDDANTLRELACLNIPSERRRMIGKLIAGTTERLPLPSLTLSQEEPLMTVAVTYTEKEAFDMLDESVWVGIKETMPQKVILSASIAMIAYLLFEMIALPVFGLAVLLNVLLPFLTTRIGLKRAIKASDGEVLKVTVALTEQALCFTGTAENGKRSRIPWERVTRAVERPSYVDYYATEKLVSIPKRCIDDMENLRRITDEKME